MKLCTVFNPDVWLFGFLHVHVMKAWHTWFVYIGPVEIQITLRKQHHHD